MKVKTDIKGDNTFPLLVGLALVGIVIVLILLAFNINTVKTDTLIVIGSVIMIVLTFMFLIIQLVWKQK